MLQSFGIQAESISSGDAAITHLEDPARKNSIDLVFMHWTMPDMDGIEATQRMQASTRISDMPLVIMLTAHGKEELVAHTESIVVNAILTKPVTPSTLLETIISSAGKGKALTTSAGLRDDLFTEAITP